MAGFAPGPWDQAEDQYCVDDGTMCRVPTPVRTQTGDWAKEYNSMSPEQRARFNARARAAARIEQSGSPQEKFMLRVHGMIPDTPQPELGAFYSKYEREVDKSPLPWVFETGWKMGELFFGETITSHKVDREELAKEVGARLIEHVFDLEMAGDMARLAGAGARSLGIGSAARLGMASEELAARQAFYRELSETPAAKSLWEQAAQGLNPTEEGFQIARNKFWKSVNADPGSDAALVREMLDEAGYELQGGTGVARARSAMPKKNIYPAFESTVEKGKGLQPKAAAQVRELSNQINLKLPEDRVLDAPWVGRIRDARGRPRSVATSEGYLRDDARFWEKFKELWPDDYKLLGPNWTVKPELAEKYGWPKSVVGEKLVHHHIKNGQFVVALPESIHKRLSGLIHGKATIVDTP